ncbi:MAG: fibrobacter succinogenes major paralogous domain-containing protein [Candidatus Nomurabacteria bacterium]|jgi:uncharacterized protein (TIGR02145 family)|nr:fibrobacter succinogenes major paralogous domain-containing protein [Candidatus Nomurabacteria bacterium]
MFIPKTRTNFYKTLSLTGNWRKAFIAAAALVVLAYTISTFITSFTINRAEAIVISDVNPSTSSATGGQVVGAISTGITPLAPTKPITMQEMTQKYCTSMPAYDKTNPDPASTLTLIDTRNNQTYDIRKMPDNNCWMIDNLKIDNYNASAADTDLNTIANFNIPAKQTTGARSNDIPGVYGPVLGDTGVGATNYGYLYNWSAVTAGETTTTMPGDGTNNNVAPNSICPRGWRLPTGSSSGEFAWLNAKMNDPDASSPSTDGRFYANWQVTGPFRGILSGWWHSSFDLQGYRSDYWSSLARAGFASGVAIRADDFSTSGGVRSLGQSVRCLALGGYESKENPPVVGVPDTGLARLEPGIVTGGASFAVALVSGLAFMSKKAAKRSKMIKL